MVSIGKYQILAKIYESRYSLVYRGIRESDERSVILKILKQDYPTPQELTRYKQEYEITANLNLPGAVKALSLEDYQNTLIIVFEDFGGESLRILTDERREAGIGVFPLQEFIHIAIQISESLSQVHGANIIHKDINPSNIVFNQQNGEIKIIDFGISTVLTRENPILKNPKILEGTLAYMSPEQTGRMNRALDYRTDFYSLGVTLYELLVNKLPFETEDALELVHCHIAKSPVSPNQINPGIPKVVSDIVMKLLAKTAESRYQNALGIKADFQECLRQLKSGKVISEFAIASQDISDKFQIPQKLYGREKEIEILLAAFGRVSNPPPILDRKRKVEMMLVVGSAGIGKSVLVQEIYKPITEKRGYFIAGKFDQYQRNIPYSAMVVALKKLIRQLLTESDASLNQWRHKILANLGNNGQVIIDVIPEIELIIGEQTQVPELPPTEAQNRFNLVFQKFINVFTGPLHPLVIFIDDLQWADKASLKLIKMLMTAADSQYLFFIGSYRDNQVSSVHPLIITTNEIAKAGVNVNKIHLKNLPIPTVNQLIADTLNLSLETTLALANLVVEKTDGNPFFVNEFLKLLDNEKLLDFNFNHPQNRGKWQFNLEEIQKQKITDNVVELMVLKIKKLPEESQNILKLAACIGNKFDLDTLAVVSEKSLTKTAILLHSAIAVGLVLPLSDNYKLIKFAVEDSSNILVSDRFSQTTIEYKFVHDRIQQAAYSLIAENELQLIHLRIGKMLWQNTPLSHRDEKIFTIVNQLNQGKNLVEEKSEKYEIAELNLVAGKKAKISAAYEPAFQYLSFGIELLDIDTWEQEYKLTLDLYVEAAAAAYLHSNFEKMENFAEKVLQKANTLLDKVKIYEVKILANQAQNRQQEAIDIGLKVLRLLGINFPDTPNQKDIQNIIQETQANLARRNIDELLDLPVMTTPEKLAIMRVLASLFPPIFETNPAFLPFVICTQIKLSIQYGNAPISAFAYALYGLILCGGIVDVELGYKFEQLALSLLEKFNAKQLEAKVFNIVGIHIRHWKKHLKTTIKLLQDGYQSGLEHGDVEFASYCAGTYCYHLYFLGKELTTLAVEIKNYSQAIAQLKQTIPFNYTQIFCQSVLNLINPSSQPCNFLGKEYNELEMLAQIKEANHQNVLFVFYINKLILCYLFGNYQEGLEYAIKTENYLDPNSGLILVALLRFYDSLVRLAPYKELTPAQQKKNLAQVRENQTKMKYWATHAPMNYLHKYYLVEAEKYRVLNSKIKAMEYYDLAIANAKENKYIQEEALSYELAAKFYSYQGKNLIAKTYILEARYCYLKWGANAKVEHIDQTYPHLLTTNQSLVIDNKALISQTQSSFGKELDLATVMKAYQAISSDIVLDKLLSKLMKILIENAGAEVGYLILETTGKLLIEAEGSVGSKQVKVLQSIPIEETEVANKVCTNIINYVARTHESVVLHDATNEGIFINDPHIIKHQPKSILCSPLINQGRLSGIVYLENNLSTWAFKKDRLEMLNMLSTQAAISIENARFYNKVAELNQAYERFVPRQFLQFLNKKSIVEVQLGDNVEQEMSVLFSDIRSFTTLSETMTPEQNFQFINAYLSRMEPVIINNYGFIDKYIGDAIMALFSGSADDAVKAGISMLHKLSEYNATRDRLNRPPIHIGIGINTGKLMLGTIGSYSRMDSTVISDAVNLASRVENLTKNYGVALLITHHTFLRLYNPNQYAIRVIDRVQVKGKSEWVTVFEVFDADPLEIREGKIATKQIFEQGWIEYHQENFTSASLLFQYCLEQNPQDQVAQIYLERCQQQIND